MIFILCDLTLQINDPKPKEKSWMPSLHTSPMGKSMVYPHFIHPQQGIITNFSDLAPLRSLIQKIPGVNMNFGKWSYNLESTTTFVGTPTNRKHAGQPAFGKSQDQSGASTDEIDEKDLKLLEELLSEQLK